MIINTIKKNILSFSVLFFALPMLLATLVAFQSHAEPQEDPGPQIKTKIHKSYNLRSNEALLLEHTKTKYNIHGEIIEYAVFTEDKNGQAALKNLKVIKYNVEGLYIGTMVYDQNNALIWSEENTYNDNEEITKITQTAYEDAPVITYTLIDYDDYGNISLSQTFDSRDHQISERKRSYSENGELLSALDWVYVVKNGKAIKKILSIDNQYNLKGQITQSTMLSQEGKNRTKDIKQFKNSAITDWSKYENGRLVSHFKHTKPVDTTATFKEYAIPPPIPEQSVPLEYDDAKRDPLENIPHKAFKAVTIKTNKLGLPTKRVTREYNQVTKVVYYYYNDKMQLESEKMHDKITRDTEEIRYEYDLHNNPVKKTILQNEELVELHSFDYEYYRHR